MSKNVAKSAQQNSDAQHEQILKRFLQAQDSLVYQTADLSLASLAGMMELEEGRRPAINLDPDFQRRARWSVEKQSGLIESFLLNVPVPPVYLAEDEYGAYSVVDGKQRLTAIDAFMTGGLALRGLDRFTELEGLTLAQLPEPLKNALIIRPYVRVVTLLKQSDPTLKFEVFTRLNRGGEEMLPQELRKVAYRGPLSDLIYELAENQFLRQQLKITSTHSSAYRNMDDAEYVLRFFALRSSWRGFSGGLRQALDNHMIENQHSKVSQIKALREEFLRCISTCQEIWGDHAFQRHTGNEWRAQLLAGMYDAEMLAVGELSNEELRKATSKSAIAVNRTAALFTDPDFEKSVRQGTNTPSFIRKRVTAVLKLLRSF